MDRTWLNLNWSDKNLKTKSWHEEVLFWLFFLVLFFQWFGLLYIAFCFFSSCRAFRHVSSYRGENYIELINEGIKNYFELAGGLSYRVRVTKGKITVNVWRKSRGNRLGSSWRGFELSGVNCMFIVPCVFLLKPILDPIITLHNKVK